MYMRMKDGFDRSDAGDVDRQDGTGRVAPGKRALADSAQPVQRSTRGDAPATGISGRSVSELVPLSSDVPFVDSIVNGDPVQRKSDTANDASTDVHALATHGTSG